MPDCLRPAPGSFAASAATTRPWTFHEDAVRYSQLGVGMEVREEKLDPARRDGQSGRLRDLGVAVTSIQPRPSPGTPRSMLPISKTRGDGPRRIAIRSAVSPASTTPK